MSWWKLQARLPCCCRHEEVTVHLSPRLLVSSSIETAYQYLYSFSQKDHIQHIPANCPIQPILDKASFCTLLVVNLTPSFLSVPPRLVFVIKHIQKVQYQRKNVPYFRMLVLQNVQSNLLFEGGSNSGTDLVVDSNAMGYDVVEFHTEQNWVFFLCFPITSQYVLRGAQNELG